MRRYESGESIPAIMRATGRSYGGVHYRLRRAGVVFNRRGGWHGKGGRRRRTEVRS